MGITQPGKKLGSGRKAVVYEWGEKQVLKLYEPRITKDRVEYEYKASLFARESGLPVPSVSGVIEHDNRYGIIIDRITGRDMLRSMLFTGISKMAQYARIMAELQVKVNSIKADKSILPLKQNIADRIDREKFIPSYIKNAATDILNKLPDNNVFCHYDLHPGNVILSPRGPVIIDWMTAGSGDRLADMARTWVLIKMPSIPWTIYWFYYPRMRYFYHEYFKQYNSIQPIDKIQFELWKIPVLAARITEEQSEARKRFLLSVLEKRLKKSRFLV
jgi:uncharacterized protein (TIGR02172 family)